MMSNKRLEIRRGYTLIEVLLAVTLGLVLMLGVVQMFAMVGNFVTGSQGLMELDQKVRSTQIMLQNDLVRYTSRMTVPADPNSAEGYFRIEENGQTPNSTADTRLQAFYGNTLTGIAGDDDDVLTFTIHDMDSPFIGRNSGGVVVNSSDAEVKWFVTKNADGYFSLYRRITILNPTEAPSAAANGNIKNASLSDMTFSPGSGGRGGSAETNYRDTNKTSSNADAVLDNVIMFDVKVWDPEYVDPTTNKKGQYVDLAKGTTFNAARGNTFDTGSRFKVSGSNVTNTATTGSATSTVINAPTPSNFSIPVTNNKSMAGITLQGIQIHVRTFDPASGVIRDFTVEQEFNTH